MTLLPPLSDEDREEIARQQREDEEREARLNELLALAADTIREAQRTMAQAKREMRFPLDSARMNDDTR